MEETRVFLSRFTGLPTSANAIHLVTVDGLSVRPAEIRDGQLPERGRTPLQL